MNKQIHIYSVDTSAFYNKNELLIHNRLNSLYQLKKKYTKKIEKYNKYKINYPNEYWEENTNIKIKIINSEIKKTKEKMYEKFKEHSGIRNINKSVFNKYNIISVFESSLTRIMKIPVNELSKNLIIVQTYFFDIIEDIIIHGFMDGDEKYVCLTASAGQIRTKKTVFIKEKVLKQYQNAITCGLTIEKINEKGGVNINKYLAYLALCNSATDLWEDFDITKTIVVDDMETMVKGEVDFIDDKTYKIDRKEMDIPINHTDGCGMVLPRKNNKNMMVRLPWVKGLLVAFPYDKFIREKCNNKGIIKDIYGVEHNILEEKIEVIFTKSQFKMWKYYNSWQEYIDNFLKYGCQAGKCNEEEDVFNNAKLNYQMIQTLTDMTDCELEKICKQTKNNIMQVGNDRKTMLKILGVTDSNTNKNYIQQALELYPELLNDTYCKEILKQVKKSMVKGGRSAKVDINGVYTFICPDLYAFCEFLFLGDKNPNGLLSDKQVYCKIYKDVEKLDCLRSPHLYREHAIRNNVVDKEKDRWFVTKGLYTSCHDIISKILMFDVDGDKSLVCADETIIKVAERNMQDIVPLYYNMAKAGAEQINSKSIYNGLKTAYTGGNIGMVSNNITKIWNSNNVNLEAIKLLCMENNFTIDYAKTLYKPIRPKDKKDMINDYTKLKTPHFFIYAKDKEKDKVEEVNNSVVNRLEKIIPNPRIKFKATNLGEFNYKILMNKKNIKLDEEIIKKYTELDLKNHFMINNYEDEEVNNMVYLYQDIKNKLLLVNNDINYVTDVLIEYLYRYKKSNFKTTLWECFGDVIVNNIKENINKGLVEGDKLCEKCGERIDKTNNKIKYCTDCAREIEKKNSTLRKRKQREKKNVTK